jgi:multimeric flavodoxin WrbA
MKVLALNSSPRAEGQSKTNLMLTSLVQGMQDAGAEVEVIELRRKTIKKGNMDLLLNMSKIFGQS